MKLYGFANFVEQHLISHEYASISLVFIEASMWLLWKGILLYDGDSQVTLMVTQKAAVDAVKIWRNLSIAVIH